MRPDGTPERGFVCRRCGWYSGKRDSLLRHQEEKHGDLHSRPLRVSSPTGLRLYHLGQRL